MNSGLSRQQVEEILAASERVDVPAGQLLNAATEIRAALLGEATDALGVVIAEPLSDGVAVRGGGGATQRARRARTRMTVVCAAALSLATSLGVATTGALPSAVQGPIAHVADFVGIELPKPDSTGGGGTDAIENVQKSGRALGSDSSGDSDTNTPSGLSGPSEPDDPRAETATKISDTKQKPAAAADHAPVPVGVIPAVLSGAGQDLGGQGEGGTPDPGFTNPGNGNPVPGFPNPGFPNPGFPNPGFPNPGFPNPGFPNPGFPNPGFPDPGIDHLIPVHGSEALEPTIQPEDSLRTP